MNADPLRNQKQCQVSSAQTPPSPYSAPRHSSSIAHKNLQLPLMNNSLDNFPKNYEDENKTNQ